MKVRSSTAVVHHQHEVFQCADLVCMSHRAHQKIEALKGVWAGKA